MLALGFAVGTGSTFIDEWSAERIGDIVGPDPRWLLVFTNGWLVAAVLGVCLTIPLRRGQWRLCTAVLICPVLAILANSGLKTMFDRHNGPYLAYPSGHTTVLVVAMGLLVVVLAGQRWALSIAIAVSVCGALGLIGCGYHYTTDTIGAALLASALVCAAAVLANRPRSAPAAPRRPAAALGLAGVTGLAGLTGLAVLAGSAVGFAAPTDAPAAGFVDIRSVIPDGIVDLRYATANNFLHTPLYPPDARCLVHEALAPGLAVAAAELRSQRRRLVFWDCYRPHAVQVAMFDAVPDPTWVARPGRFARSHTAGRSVDVTIADPAGRLVDMGTDFDDFSPRAAASATAGISAAAAANRALLRDAMRAGGLVPYASEWWHFDGPGAGVERPLLDVHIN